jgi:hypothetical protein
MNMQVRRLLRHAHRAGGEELLDSVASIQQAIQYVQQ